mmetsp:Transcript_19311/g.59986  ORF Transcript_19311/g.59986 Transcript_19311/m.59986 type:complete len:222 (-) Transcript_19311:203-868(-)
MNLRKPTPTTLIHTRAGPRRNAFVPTRKPRACVHTIVPDAPAPSAAHTANASPVTSIAAGKYFCGVATNTTSHSLQELKYASSTSTNCFLRHQFCSRRRKSPSLVRRCPTTSIAWRPSGFVTSSAGAAPTCDPTLLLKSDATRQNPTSPGPYCCIFSTMLVHVNAYSKRGRLDPSSGTRICASTVVETTPFSNTMPSSIARFACFRSHLGMSSVISVSPFV